MPRTAVYKPVRRAATANDPAEGVVTAKNLARAARYIKPLPPGIDVTVSEYEAFSSILTSIVVLSRNKKKYLWEAFGALHIPQMTRRFCALSMFTQTLAPLMTLLTFCIIPPPSTIPKYRAFMRFHAPLEFPNQMAKAFLLHCNNLIPDLVDNLSERFIELLAFCRGPGRGDDGKSPSPLTARLRRHLHIELCRIIAVPGFPATITMVHELLKVLEEIGSPSRDPLSPSVPKAIHSVRHEGYLPLSCGNQSCRVTPEQQCSRCKDVAYCTEMCQYADWKGHKHICFSPAYLARRWGVSDIYGRTHPELE